MIGTGDDARRAVQPVSAIVCAHDPRRLDSLRAAVDSLLRQTQPPAEIVVVVDHEAQLLEQARDGFANVASVVANRYGRGLSGARNTGIEASSGLLVAFLDDDARAEPDWIERLARLCRDSRVLGAGGRVVPNWLGRRPPWFPDEFLWVVGCTYRGAPTVLSEVRNVYGGCFCIRRDVLESVGGFRSELGRVGANWMGCEETELCIRAVAARPNSAFVYDPDAVIHHDVPASRLSWAYFRRRCYAEGLSKATLTRLVGSAAGLSSERAHAARALPLGMARSVARAVVRRDAALASAAGAIAAGLAFTVVGYVRGRVGALLHW